MWLAVTYHKQLSIYISNRYLIMIYANSSVNCLQTDKALFYTFLVDKFMVFLSFLADLFKHMRMVIVVTHQGISNLLISWACFLTLMKD